MSFVGSHLKREWNAYITLVHFTNTVLFKSTYYPNCTFIIILCSEFCNIFKFAFLSLSVCSLRFNFVISWQYFDVWLDFENETKKNDFIVKKSFHFELFCKPLMNTECDFNGCKSKLELNSKKVELEWCKNFCQGYIFFLVLNGRMHCFSMQVVMKCFFLNPEKNWRRSVLSFSRK